MINFIVWLLFGALVGWLASIVMRTDAQQGLLLNIVVGIVGAFLGGIVFNFLGIGGGTINNSNFSPSPPRSFITNPASQPTIAPAISQSIKFIMAVYSFAPPTRIRGWRVQRRRLRRMLLRNTAA